MFGLTYKLNKRMITKYFMSQDALNRFIALIKLHSDFQNIKVLPNDLRLLKK